MNNNELISIMEESLIPATIDYNELVLNNYFSLPLTELAGLGTALTPFTKTVQNITVPSGEKLFTLNTRGYTGELLKHKDGSGFLSAINTSDGLGQVAFNEYKGALTSTTTTFNPATLFLAAAVISINQKLDEIKETQDDILSFLTEKEKTLHRSNLDTLFDIISEYKHNWNNAIFKQAKINLVDQIKKDSDIAIKLYKSTIEKQLNKNKLLHSDIDVKKTVSKLISNLSEYQLAMYNYGFSTFLSIMLLENFDSNFIKEAINKLENLSYEYLVIYTECYNKIEEISNKSIETLMLKGFSTISKATGEKLANIPVLNKSPLDEALISTGKILNNIQTGKPDKTAQRLISQKDNCIKIFIEKLNLVDNLFNSQVDILVNNKMIYFKPNAEVV